MGINLQAAKQAKSADTSEKMREDESQWDVKTVNSSQFDVLGIIVQLYSVSRPSEWMAQTWNLHALKLYGMRKSTYP